LRTFTAAALAAFTALTALASAPAAAQPSSTAVLAGTCANCHGTAGRSAGGMPSLAGQPEAYLVQQMQAFRDGKRPATIMHQLAKGYTDEQIQALAKHYAGLKGQ
jgi:sulfide dehydrogenase cytochrome subunit